MKLKQYLLELLRTMKILKHILKPLCAEYFNNTCFNYYKQLNIEI